MQEWNKKTGYKMADRQVGYRGEKFDPYCFQRQLRDRKDTGERVGLDGEIREITFHEAQDFILEYEWLGTMGTTQFSYGFFVNGRLTAVECFGVTAGTQALSEPFGAEHKREGIVLVRGACAPWAHEHTSSFMMGQVFPLVRDRGYNFVIAYSDPEAGEIGTVYQATNWSFYGMTSSVTYLVRPDGKRVDPKLISKYAKKFDVSYSEQKQNFIDEGYTFEKGSPKLKYFKIIGNKTDRKNLMRDLRVPILPYMKRKNDMSEISADYKKLLKESRDK